MQESKTNYNYYLIIMRREHEQDKTQSAEIINNASNKFRQVCKRNDFPTLKNRFKRK